MKIGNVTAIARLSPRSSIPAHFTARLTTGGAQPAPVARLALRPDREQLRDIVGDQLGQAHRIEHLADRDLDLLHRPPQVAARHLRTVTVALHALDDVDRSLDRPHHLAYRDLSRAPGQHVTALRPVLADNQPLTG